MEANLEVSDEIRKLQDSVVTLRMNIPTMYKNLLLKECEIEHQLLTETDVCVPKQPVQELKKIERVPKQMFPSNNGVSGVQDVDNLLNTLHKLFPKKAVTMHRRQQSCSSSTACSSW